MLHWEDEVKPSPQLSAQNATGHRPEAPSSTPLEHERVITQRRVNAADKRIING